VARRKPSRPALPSRALVETYNVAYQRQTVVIESGEIPKFTGGGRMEDVPTDRYRLKPVKDNTDIGIRPGRESSRDLVRDEAQRRLNAGERPKTLKAFAKRISDCLKKVRPKKPTMAPDRVESAIRDIWQKHFS
jgi:hypothetical protein